MNHSSIAIVSVQDVDETEWLRVCEGCDYATIFHTPFWPRLFSEYLGRGRPRGFKILFNDSLSAIVPFFALSRFAGGHCSWSSSAAGTYGGWISLDPLTENHSRLILSYILRKRNLVLRENPFAAWQAVDIDGLEEDFTQVLDLRESGPGIVAASAHRKALSKAAREDISIRKAETAQDWKAYYSLYQDSQRRWNDAGSEGKKGIVYGEKLFEILCRESDIATLWLALKEERIIAGLLCFYWNHHTVAWHGAALESHFHLRPNNLL